MSSIPVFLISSVHSAIEHMLSTSPVICEMTAENVQDKPSSMHMAVIWVQYKTWPSKQGVLKTLSARTS